MGDIAKRRWTRAYETITGHLEGLSPVLDAAVRDICVEEMRQERELILKRDREQQEQTWEKVNNVGAAQRRGEDRRATESRRVTELLPGDRRSTIGLNSNPGAAAAKKTRPSSAAPTFGSRSSASTAAGSGMAAVRPRPSSSTRPGKR